MSKDFDPATYVPPTIYDTETVKRDTAETELVKPAECTDTVKPAGRTDTVKPAGRLDSPE